MGLVRGEGRTITRGVGVGGAARVRLGGMMLLGRGAMCCGLWMSDGDVLGLEDMDGGGSRGSWP